MKLIKRVFYKTLSQKAYLKLLHRSFYLLYDMNLLKNDPRFKYHYMIRKIIKPDFVVLDIGANLGYFSKNFARLTPKGKVISIEPVPTFFQILKGFMGKFKHVTLHNVALGNENGTITMVLPESDGMIRTGLPHIASSEEEKKQHKTQEVRIVKGSELLKDLERLDYLKCDIEGYELNVFKEIYPVIEKHLPYIQVEVADDNANEMINLLAALGYTQFGIANFKFVRDEIKQHEQGDYFFVPSTRLNEFTDKFL